MPSAPSDLLRTAAAIDYRLSPNWSGITPTGYEHLLNNQAEIYDRIAELDTAALTAQANRDGGRIATLATKAEADAKVAAAAAELTVGAEPLLEAIQAQGEQMRAMQERMRAMQAQVSALQAQAVWCTVM